MEISLFIGEHQAEKTLQRAINTDYSENPIQYEVQNSLS